jgi:hypothetical protein
MRPPVILIIVAADEDDGRMRPARMWALMTPMTSKAACLAEALASSKVNALTREPVPPIQAKTG